MVHMIGREPEAAAPTMKALPSRPSAETLFRKETNNGPASSPCRLAQVGDHKIQGCFVLQEDSPFRTFSE